MFEARAESERQWREMQMEFHARQERLQREAEDRRDERRAAEAKEAEARAKEFVRSLVYNYVN